MSGTEKRLTLRILGVFALILLIVSLVGCATLQQQVQQPTVRLANVAFLGGDLRQQTYAVTLDVENPNGFALPVRVVNYRVRLANKDFANGATGSPFSIPANGSDQVQIRVNTNLLDSISHLAALLQGGAREVEYNLSGDVEINLPLVGAIPFSQSGTIALTTERNAQAM